MTLTPPAWLTSLGLHVAIALPLGIYGFARAAGGGEHEVLSVSPARPPAAGKVFVCGPVDEAFSALDEEPPPAVRAGGAEDEPAVTAARLKNFARRMRHSVKGPLFLPFPRRAG